MQFTGPNERRKPPGAAIGLLALFLVLVAPVVSFVSYQQYSFLRVEFWILLGWISVLAAALSMALVVLRRPLLRALYLGVFLSISIAIMSDWISLVLPAAVISAAWLLYRHFASVVCVSFATFIASTIAMPSKLELVDIREPPMQEPVNRDLPPIVHIVLDEHIGIEGIPTESESGRQLKDDLRRFYEEYGFRAYGRAYSQYLRTTNAIPNLLNFTSLDEDQAYIDENDELYPWVLTSNAYFDHLAARGYALRVYQSNYIDYCRLPNQNVEFCLSYQFNSIKSIQDVSLDPVEKAQFILNSFLRSSELIRKWRNRYLYARRKTLELGWDWPFWHEGMSEVGPLSVLPVFERLQREVAEDPRGRVFFAHFHLPHFPYVVDADCRVRPRIADWRMRYMSASRGDRENTPESRLERYELYFDQIRCQQKMLRTLLDRLDRTPSWNDGLLILQGDHGSRIFNSRPSAQNIEHASHEDLLAGFSTLFVVRGSGFEPGYDLSPRPVSSLLAEVMGIAPESSDKGHIFLSVEGDSKMMPRGPVEFYPD